MRHSTLCLAFVVVSLGPGLARAADLTPKGKLGETSTPASSPSSGQKEPAAAVNEGELRRDPGDAVFKKWWQLDAVWETHVMLLPYDIDHEGTGSAKLLNYGYLGARANLSKHDRVSARMGMSIYALADQGESGVRASDLSVSYTRLQPLGHGFELRPSLSVLAPTSYHSWHDSGLYLGITGAVGAAYQYKILSVEVRVFGSGYVQHYRSELGGNPNPIGGVGGSLAVNIEMPFWRQLSIGGAFYDEYQWLYMPNDPTRATTTDGTFGNSQPWAQAFGVEGFVDIRLPYLRRVVFDLHLAYGVGDPQLGYMSVLYDGATRIFGYGPVRMSSSVYAALAARF
jgi:hypothetical protein